MADSVLRAAGYHSGRYTSPHLVDVRERFTVDGVHVSREQLGSSIVTLKAAVDRLMSVGRLTAPPTYFEATTAVAFDLFRQARVDVAVCEVGLGGRLDATNVLRPLATAITSIALDHQEQLGTTLRAIAMEKAGIIKPGVPVIVGRMPSEARDAIVEIAADRQAPLIDASVTVVVPDSSRPNRFQLRTSSHDYGTVELGLAGTHQIENACVAVGLIEAAAARGLPLPFEAVAKGLQAVSWPGRLEHRHLSNGRQILLDAGHNPDGAEALASFLESSGWVHEPLVFGVMRDKDAGAMLRVLSSVVGPLVLTRASTPRSADPNELADLARRLDSRREVMIEPVVANALGAAWSRSARIVAAGSIFLLGDIMRELDAT
jgi:dihydrofolate synthase/folylpolyglutamate synthase